MNIFDIERYATKDGPGIRTVLFFKGCNLRCIWCQNPESQKFEKQVMYYKNKCSGCGKCIIACPEQAISASDKFGLVTDHYKCSVCGMCVDSCFYDARKMIGQDMTADEVMEVILADKSFYTESGGGVTFSGGEPLLRAADVIEIARRCKAEGINTAIETAGAVEWKVIEPLLGLIDLFFIDMKHIDSNVHKQYTGLGNEKILQNIQKIGALHKNTVVRIPVIPGVNHSPDVIRRMLVFLAEQTDIHEIELLPFHRLGLGKYEGLGLRYPCASIANVETTECLEYEKIGKALGLSVHTGAL